MVMNTQLVKMVIIMNMLNSVEGKVKESERAGGEGRWTEGLLAQSSPFRSSLSPPCLSPAPALAPLGQDMSG